MTHYHLWSQAGNGQEYFNAIYENKIDAALKYLSIVRGLAKNDEYLSNEIKIETVVNSFEDDEDGLGIRFGVFHVMLTSCPGGCFSPMWN